MSSSYLKYPISHSPANLGGTPVVIQNRLSCTCIRAGPVDNFAFDGAVDTSTKYCMSSPRLSDILTCFWGKIQRREKKNQSNIFLFHCFQSNYKHCVKKKTRKYIIKSRWALGCQWDLFINLCIYNYMCVGGKLYTHNILNHIF